MNGARLRQLRRARGYTQEELAKLAGVSERTVRHAEAGRRIRCDFLRFLGIALAVEPAELSAHADDLRAAELTSKKIDRILEAIMLYGNDRDLSGYRELLAENARLQVPGPAAIPFVGEYRGVSGAQRLLEKVADMMAHEQQTDLEIRASGNLVLVRFVDTARVFSTGRQYQCWCQYIFEFENGRAVRVDNLFDTASVLQAFTPGDDSA